MREYLVRTSHSPRPLPSGRWVMTQRWNDLLFAHWPIPTSAIAPHIPDGLNVDTFHGSAWLGVVPFWMDRIKLRGMPPIPFARSFPELNLRTYVRDKRDRHCRGSTFSLSRPATCWPWPLPARIYSLPYHWAEMRLEQRSEREFSFYSRRRGTGQAGDFQGALSRTRSHPQTGREPQRFARIFPDRALLPVYPQPGRRTDAGQHPPHPVAARRSRGRDRAKRSCCRAGDRTSRPGPGAALFPPPGGLRVATRAHGPMRAAQRIPAEAVPSI